MTNSLNVIALISGGKDSFLSILHCIQNGHKIIALGNLYPPPAPPSKSHSRTPSQAETVEDSEVDAEEEDLNSFMYQTVGHTVIPLYEQALGIPLYRQQILGGAIYTGTSYDPSAPETGPESRDAEADETESLVPLLRRIQTDFPHANALSTGAILSTYQRTRVESVALRLGLTPLSYLWQYPTLPPGMQTSLLRDMLDVGLDARIVKVASGGLDESFLWENVASEAGMARVERSMKRFGVDGDGSVLGEGGEFETLVVDGPDSLFRGRIEIREEHRDIVREGGGSAWLRILRAEVVMKSVEAATSYCRVPEVLDQRFKAVLGSLTDGRRAEEPVSISQVASLSFDDLDSDVTDLSSLNSGHSDSFYCTVTGNGAQCANVVISKIQQILDHWSLQSSSIVSTTIILRSMADFASVNSVYGMLFTAPNPPSRKTISCGDLLPKDINIIIVFQISTLPLPPSSRKALHVQSRSYWAPANIGPYSQATSIPIPPQVGNESSLSTVSIAGQIPLIPASMILPSPLATGREVEDFVYQTVLSLQHLFRIGVAMSVSWFTGTVTYLPSSQLTSLSTRSRAILAGEAWAAIHARPSDDDDEDSSGGQRDLWEEKHYAELSSMGKTAETKSLPDWETVEVNVGDENKLVAPIFWAAEVEELPRGAGVEWAALPGIVGGGVKITRKETRGASIVEQCRFGTSMQTVIMISRTRESGEIRRRVEDSLRAANIEAASRTSASWLNLSTVGLGEALDAKTLGGIVPCRSLWDSKGGELAAVLVFNSTAKD